MATSAVRAKEPKTLSKREVIEILGKSKRTVETYIADGKLPCTYLNGRNGKQAFFDPADVAAFKRKIENPVSSVARERLPVSEPPKSSPVIAPPAPTALPPPDYWADVARLVGALTPLGPKPWMNLEEAAAWSGLPRSYLIQQAREGTIRAVNVGTGAKTFWRFNREALGK